MKTNSLRDIWTVIKFTMRDMINRKSFRISTIIILIIIILGFNVPNILQSFGGEILNDTILISDPENSFTAEIEDIIKTSSDYRNDHYELESTNDNQDTIKEKISNSEASSAIIITKSDDTLLFDFIVKNKTTSETEDLYTVADQIKSIYVNNQINNLHLTKEQLSNIRPTVFYTVLQVDEQEVGGNLFAVMMLSIVLFFAIYFCAFQVSSSITVEKTSKIMETLVTSTSPRIIVLGKTIGIGLVGLGQILLFAITAIFSAYIFLDSALLDSILDLSNFTIYLAVIMIAYFILGYFAYALIYALTGSTVSKPEDIQSANTPVALLTVFSFYLAYFTLMNPTGDLNTFAAFFPFSSPFCMPLRVMMGIASVWEVLLSIGILIVACVIIAHVAIKIYSNAILNYGAKMSLKDIIRTYKDHS